MKRALFVDFDDSFTFNVVQEIKNLGLEVEVIHWSDFEESPGHDLLVLGPGPGHPDDYERIFPLVKNWLNEERPFVGICLGHQIFWAIKGEKVERSLEPMHGQKIELELTRDWQEWLGLGEKVLVQRYNSLGVKCPPEGKYPGLSCLSFRSELMITRGKNVITYQFHPESMGTSFREAFFNPIIRDLV